MGGMLDSDPWRKATGSPTRSSPILERKRNACQSILPTSEIADDFAHGASHETAHARSKAICLRPIDG